jgi:hypothetical protein
VVSKWREHNPTRLGIHPLRTLDIHDFALQFVYMVAKSAPSLHKITGEAAKMGLNRHFAARLVALTCLYSGA